MKQIGMLTSNSSYSRYGTATANSQHRNRKQNLFNSQGQHFLQPKTIRLFSPGFVPESMEQSGKTSPQQETKTQRRILNSINQKNLHLILSRYDQGQHESQFQRANFSDVVMTGKEMIKSKHRKPKNLFLEMSRSQMKDNITQTQVATQRQLPYPEKLVSESVMLHGNSTMQR